MFARTSRNRMLQIIGVVVILATVLAGCTTAAKPTAVPTAVPAPATSDVFIFGAQGEPVCLDPAIITDGISGRVTAQVFENLVKFDGSTVNIIPSLAEKWTVSPDYKVWTFTLRKGVKFHDGTDFNADAVLKNWDYWYNSANPLHKKQLDAGQTFEYYEAQFNGFDDKSLITKVEAIDASTVKFTLSDPQAFFLNNLAIFSFGLWSPTALEKAGADSCKMPVGTGPFTFVEWKPNEQVTLQRNEGYWDAAHKAKVAKVIIRNIGDNAQRLAALKTGEVHAIEGVNTDDIKGIQADQNLQILYRPPNTTGYVAFNFKIKEFQDKRVREAFAHAINKKAIVENVYNGTVMAAKEMQPPSLWGYNDAIQDYDYNPDKARQLLTEAGFPNGLSEITLEDGKKQPLEFWYMSRSRPYFPSPKDAAEAMSADLAKAGIKVNLMTVEWAQYLDKRKVGQLPLYMLGWTGDNGDPDNFICYFFCKPGLDREGFYTNQTVHDLLTKAGVSIDQKERADLYKKAEQALHDDVARLFIVHTTPPIVTLKKVQGYVVHPTATEYFNGITVLK